MHSPHLPASLSRPLFRRILCFLALLLALPCAALPAKLGDLDEDGVPTILDVAKLAAHFRGTHPLSAQVALFADMNQDGALNEADQEALAGEILQLSTPRDLPLTTIRESSPARGEANVAVTRETILQFAHPLSPFTSIDTTRFHADFGGRKILSCVQLSNDRKKVTLFYLEPLPSNARVIVTFDGNGLNDLIGRPIDMDGDGQPGGVYTTEFETISITPVPNTGMTGIVYASERGTGGAEVPLAGVTITVDGAEESLRCVTGADGHFSLSPCPSGQFFVHIDGRTAPVSHYPNGSYFPSVGKKWFAVPGRLNNPAGALNDTPNGGGTGVIYLPCICAGTLAAVSQTQDTLIHFPASVIAANPALAGTEIRVPANSLFADDGTRGGKIGIAPVAPDRLPAPLPPGLNPPMVFTVQSDGPTNFDRPVPVCLPNLPDPVTGKRLEPGAKSALFSFNHDLGEWEIRGSMTVSEDGNCVTTDAGVGIRQPGWHTSQPGVQFRLKCPPPPDKPPTIKDIVDFANEATKCLVGVDPGSAFSCLQQLAAVASQLYVTQNTLREKLTAQATTADILSAIQSLLAAKNTIADAWEDCNATVQETLSVAKRALACAKALLSLINLVCRSVVMPPGAGNGCESPSTIIEYVCVGTDILSRGIDYIEKSIKAVEKRFSEFGLEVLCSAADVMITAAQEYLASRGARGVRGGQTAISPAFFEASKTIERMTNEIAATRTLTEESLNEIHGLSSQSSVIRDAASSLGGDDVVGSYIRIQVGGVTIRRFVDAAGFNLILPENTNYSVSYFKPIPAMLGAIEGRTGNSGETRYLAFPRFTPATGLPDDDNDGIVNEGELILGLNPFNPDTNGDGISDMMELISFAGVSTPAGALSGSAAQTKVATSAADTSASSSTLAIACGSEGTAFLLTQGIAAPTLRTRVPTTSLSVAVGVGADAALIAESEAGFRCVSLDASLNVTSATLLPVPGRAISAVASGGIGYGGTSGGAIWELDLASGGLLRQLDTGAGEIEDLVVQGDWLFARKPDRLLAVQLSGPAMTVAGQLVLSTGRTPSRTRLRIAPAEGAVFCTMETGLQIVNTTALPSLSLKGTVNGPLFNWRHFIPNGATGVLAGLPLATGVASLFSIPASGTTANFLTSFEMPGNSNAVALNRGVAYVTCENGTLSVLNYLDFDRNRVPPTITLSSNANLTAPMPQVEEGSSMRLSASVTDDVQVGNVEFYVDGVLVFDDGTYPFEHRFLAPRRSATKTTFKVKARAVDTGGNATWSTESTVTMLPDMVPPTVRSILPASNTMKRTVANIYVRFSELMDAGTLTAPAFTLVSAGPDAIFDTADDSTIPYFLVYRDSDSLVRLALDAPLPPGRYRMHVAPPVSDATGNAMAAATESSFRVYSLTDTDHDGIPDDWEALLGTNPNNPDSNGNGILDGLEDRDNDGTPDGVEITQLDQDPRIADMNNNGIADGLEDSDSDGLLDGQEAVAGTNIYNSDSDGDGLDDSTELAAGLNPRASNLSPSITAVSPLVNVLNASYVIAPIIPTPVQSSRASLLNAQRETAPVIATPVQSPTTSFLNAQREITPVIPTPVQSGPTTFKNNPTPP